MTCWKGLQRKSLEDEELPPTLDPGLYKDLPGLTKEHNASLKLAVQRYNAQAFLLLARHIFPQSELFHSETLLSSLVLDLNPPKADLLSFVSAILASFRGNVRSRIALDLVRGLHAAGALSPKNFFGPSSGAPRLTSPTSRNCPPTHMVPRRDFGGAIRPRDGRPEPHFSPLSRFAHPEPGDPTPHLCRRAHLSDVPLRHLDRHLLGPHAPPRHRLGLNLPLDALEPPAPPFLEAPTSDPACPPALLDCNLPPRYGQPQLPPSQRGVRGRQGARPLREAACRGGSIGRRARVWTGTAGRHGARWGRPD
ncbi:hypothetical protein M427DRAFT_156279 [Gonapodya prolifera JEL478]|uniref:Uncharacterized protein n=1 Tax=Gonapodya prolifera (strain JEL478) TaxID=1344416 RepID=A0A139AAU6_GONPJ|nr:hypothetical protein M427DRAFT_156279 [Gonapodya prolifera JEL478]|eukprot:KXS13828.1 hypothetical protein M427DRAFT_156279 [Gonapodya prolifera JEL478]